MSLDLHLNRLIVTIGLLLGLTALDAPALAQNAANVQLEDTDVTIDALGNATFVLKGTYPAAAWENYKENYGGNPSLLKRDLQHQYSSMSLRGIDLKNDDMNRTSTLTWQADAAAEYRDSGVWEVELVKGAQVTKVSDTLWQLTSSSPMSNGVITQNTIRVHLPPNARSVEQAQSETGTPVLRYALPDPPRSPLPWLSALAGILGVLLLIAGFIAKPRTYAAAPLPQVRREDIEGETVIHRAEQPTQRGRS